MQTLAALQMLDREELDAAPPICQIVSADRLGKN
jgi:hypothetical protein